jgi:hypothetical protein
MVKAVGIDVSLVEVKDELRQLIAKVDGMLEFIKEETEEYDPEHGACCRNGCMKCER